MFGLYGQFYNGSSNWWDASVAAPLRVDATSTGEKNNMVAFRILSGAGTFRRRGDIDEEKVYSVDPEVLQGVDIAHETAVRKMHSDTYIVPRLVAAVRGNRRSSFVAVVNETSYILLAIQLFCKDGHWTREPPSEIFANETIVFGSESGIAKGTEASVEYIVLDGSGQVLTRLWLAWGNPLIKDARGKWWDAECAAPLRVEAVATPDDNNRVSFRLCAGAGTTRKYCSDGSRSSAVVGNTAAIVLGEEEMALEMDRRRDGWNENVLPLLVQAQLKATRSTFVTISNHTTAMFTRASFDLKGGMWNSEPPAEIFPGEMDVPFGSQSRGVSSNVEGTLTLITDTADAGPATIWLKWSNAGRGHIYADAEAPHGFSVEVTASDAENNKVTITIGRGDGTSRGSMAMVPLRESAVTVVAAAERSDEVIREGWVLYRNEGGRFGKKDFQRRWCVLSAARVRLFDKQNGKSKVELQLGKARLNSAKEATPDVLELMVMKVIHPTTKAARTLLLSPSRRADWPWVVFVLWQDSSWHAHEFKIDVEEVFEQWSFCMQRAVTHGV